MCRRLNEDIFTFRTTGNLISSKGMDDGEYIKAFLYDAVMRAGLSPSLTFDELRKRRGKRLIVCSTDVKNQRAIYFTPEAHPMEQVVDAVRSSMGVPILLTPTESTIDGTRCLLSDGGIMDNFPIKFALADFSRRYAAGTPHLSVIGCNLASPPMKEIPDIRAFLVAVWSCVRRQRPDYGPCTVNVEVSDWEAFNFSASDAARRKLFQAGMEATKAHLLRKNIHGTSALRRRKSA
jgi:predicted acylesterase/phospholipase RssA